MTAPSLSLAERIRDVAALMGGLWPAEPLLVIASELEEKADLMRSTQGLASDGVMMVELSLWLALADSLARKR